MVSSVAAGRPWQRPFTAQLLRVSSVPFQALLLLRPNSHRGSSSEDVAQTLRVRSELLAVVTPAQATDLVIWLKNAGGRFSNLVHNPGL